MPSCGASNDERGACVIPDSFQSIHAHGLVRIAAATPKASTGDVQANVDATLALARLASDKGADLVLFPELNISSSAIRSEERRVGMACVGSCVSRGACSDTNKKQLN